MERYPNVRFIKILNTCIVGTGAAGFNAAIRMLQFGCDSVAIITENVNAGTSRNTGSDKQTYYKLGLCGDTLDCVKNMAENFFAGGCVDGDNALVEAALSARCFLNLCELGVPFPVDRFGQYVGYKTDHDPYARATSAGPLTSKFMTECLEKKAYELGIVLYDGHTVIEILKKGNEVCGLVTLLSDGSLAVFICKNVIWATGGPAGIYSNSVYPECHHGSSGVAFEAGARGQNLTEWQYGLASTSPRWNVSGTYMQVLPRFISVDANGKEHEFLADYFGNVSEMLSMVFLKGYQWPFDCKKVQNGSSVIDLLVYREEYLLGRKVYLDFRTNPLGLEALDYSSLSEDARIYLEKAHACFGRPIDRLEHMNAPAVSLYRDKGVDLHTEMLPVSLCAQHNNGGIAVDMWWQTAVKGLFACGEVAGTHGITRPGGSALNAGQVGSLRAAQYASAVRSGEPDAENYENIICKAVEKHLRFIHSLKNNPDNVDAATEKAQKRMSRVGATIRNPDEIKKAIRDARKELKSIAETGGNATKIYRLKDILTAQIVYLSAMADYCDKGYGSRGSYIIHNENGTLREGLEETFRFIEADPSLRSVVQEVAWSNGECTVSYRPVRPIPDEDIFFENIWKTYRENGNIY